MPQLSTINYEN